MKENSTERGAVSGGMTFFRARVHALETVHSAPNIVSGHGRAFLDEGHEGFHEGSDIGTLRLHSSEA